MILKWFVAPKNLREYRGRIYVDEAGTPASLGKEKDKNKDNGFIKTREKTRFNDNDTEECEACHQTFKKSGINIHHAKSKCGEYLGKRFQDKPKRKPFIVSQEFHNKNRRPRRKAEELCLPYIKTEPISSESEEDVISQRQYRQRSRQKSSTIPVNLNQSMKQGKVSNWVEVKNKRQSKIIDQFQRRRSQKIEVITLSDEESRENVHSYERPTLASQLRGEPTSSDEELYNHMQEWED